MAPLRLAAITRYLAELGARVDRVDATTPDSADLTWIAANVGKQAHVGTAGEPAIDDLLAHAHAWVGPSDLSEKMVEARKARTGLVTMAVSDFGSDGPLSSWQATDPVLHALSGELSRSGVRGKPPLLPPGDLAFQCASAQGGYALLAAVYRAVRTGAGDHLDFSALDGAVQALDPGYGVSGSATMGKPAHLLSRDRPARGFQYPILRCADGHVRLCLLSKRQWRGMFHWMDEPAQFSDPSFDSISVRYKSRDLLPAIAAFFADRSRDALEAEAQSHGVPLSAVLTFEEFTETEHIRARGALHEVYDPDGAPVTLPNGVLSIDGQRMGPTEKHVDASFPPPDKPPGRAFDGLKVLDMGVIVVGAEQSRLLGDQGADVIKLESRAFPDGNRQSYLSYGMSVSFAAGHRNKRSLGLNLRDRQGKALFLELAKKADVILSNFKPGTLETLGLSYNDLKELNAGIVMADSSAFGATGPWSGRMGYGPLVRAATGLTLAWRYPDEAEGFSDSVTIYPDHVAARIGAVAVVALLIRRLRTGRGGSASVAQSEVMLSHFAADVARLSRGRPIDTPTDWPWSAYRTDGEDDWCVVTVRGTDDWRALSAVTGMDASAYESAEQRLAARDAIDSALQAWLAGYRSDEAARLLQQGGVPAAPMIRVAELPGHPYYTSRGFYRTETHPYLTESVTSERRHIVAEGVGDAPSRPAPLMGEHSSEIIAEWLGLNEAEIDKLTQDEVLEPVDPDKLAAAEETKSRQGGK
jgi:crotonobetainyl-CoA:carnitine CoA-transferase CaiB-like acyl-CoA transferase